MHGHVHLRMHGNAWLMPVILLIVLACILVWGWSKYRRYRRAVDDRQGVLDLLKRRSLREPVEDDTDV